MARAAVPKQIPVSRPSFKPLIHPWCRLIYIFKTAKPMQVINIHTNDKNINKPIPFFEFGSETSIFKRDIHLGANNNFEYHAAPNIKKASAATKIEAQFRPLKNKVFITVSFGEKLVKEMYNLFSAAYK